MEQNNNLKYNGIQCLRGIAALLVMWSHLRFVGDFSEIKWIMNGASAIGVDIFFVISGFVISISAKNLEFNVVKFLIYRLTRIIPFYWLMSIPLVIYNINMRIWNWNSFINTVIFIPLFDTTVYTNPIHWLGWTLSFEFWFYCLFAIFIGTFRRKSFIIMPIFLVIMCLSTTFLYTSAYYLPKFIFHPFTLEFVSGVLIYVIAYKFHYKSLIISGAVAIIFGLLSLTFDNFGGHMFILADFKLGFQRFFIWGIFGISIMIFFISIDNLKIFQWSKSFILLGNSSYSLYLIQPYSILISNKLSSNFGLSHFYSGVVYVLFVILCGITLSKTIEIPITKLSREIFKKYIFINTFKPDIEQWNFVKKRI